MFKNDPKFNSKNHMILYTNFPSEEEMKEIAKDIKTANLAITKKENKNLLAVIEKMVNIINELDIELCTVLSNNDIKVTGNLTGERYEEIMEYITRIEKDLETQEYIKNMVKKERNKQNETKRKNVEP